MKHTPTPWHVGSKVPNYIYARDGLDIIAQCDSANESTRAEENANAAHIVRCVNAHDALIAALEGAIIAMERMNDASDEGGLLGHEYDACCAALKLAKGE
jgi:hypothetical protein